MSSLREQLRDDLARAGLAPRHALGQNFMVDKSAVDALVGTAALGPGCRVCEVGPGTGILTERLLASGAEVLAVEYDHGMAALLTDKLVPRGLTLVQGDALNGKNDVNPAIAAFAAAGPWQVAANLPYDISIPFLLNCLQLANPPRHAVVTVQLEAAQRLCAEPGTSAWGASAAVCRAAAAGRIVRRLPPRCFYPAPRVDSAILELTPQQAVPAGFGRWCRTVFAYRRKRVSRALRNAGLERDAALAAVAAVGLTEERRWEELTVDELLALYAAVGQEMT
ncbi:MAG: 16S rRNA (adenine(1518)-N(6)/adenine(1519)-N(6))-dimethyltransferase RsmA [Planctomycetota bacterium]|jgi:16S rRNA (adenine1518-N6/adenine1519-N6)-dimethyltransferase